MHSFSLDCCTIWSRLVKPQVVSYSCSFELFFSKIVVDDITREDGEKIPTLHLRNDEPERLVYRVTFSSSLARARLSPTFISTPFR